MTETKPWKSHEVMVQRLVLENLVGLVRIFATCPKKMMIAGIELDFVGRHRRSKMYRRKLCV